MLFSLMDSPQIVLNVFSCPLFIGIRTLLTAFDAESFDGALESFQTALGSLRAEPRLPPELQSLELQLLDGVAAFLQKLGKDDEALSIKRLALSQFNSFTVGRVMEDTLTLRCWLDFDV